jgi:hypothetical protein
MGLKATGVATCDVPSALPLATECTAEVVNAVQLADVAI